MCTSGETVPLSFTCDMENDCKDMSDEDPKACAFTCGSGESIPKGGVCDGEPASP
jgi:hypothetical protein